MKTMAEKKSKRQQQLDEEVEELLRQGKTGSKPLEVDRQERYCQEYIIDLSVVDAGVRAGYTGPPYRLMYDPEVILRISYLKRERQRKLQLDQMAVVDELKRLAFSNILDYVIVDEDKIEFRDGINDPDHPLNKNGGVIQELNIQSGKNKRLGIKLHDKIQALDKLMRHMDMFERARLEIEREKLELLKLKQAPETSMEIGDDGFIEAMEGAAALDPEDIGINTEEFDGNYEED